MKVKLNKKEQQQCKTNTEIWVYVCCRKSHRSFALEKQSINEKNI